MREPLPRIPVPLKQRWQDLRLKAIPVFVFAAAVMMTALLWKQTVAAPTLVG